MTIQPEPNKPPIKTATRPATGIPRWIKVIAIIGVLIILGFVALHFAGGGFGPGTHGM